jgi:hypothetical protein
MLVHRYSAHSHLLELSTGQVTRSTAQRRSDHVATSRSRSVVGRPHTPIITKIYAPQQHTHQPTGTVTSTVVTVRIQLVRTILFINKYTHLCLEHCVVQAVPPCMLNAQSTYNHPTITQRRQWTSQAYSTYRHTANTIPQVRASSIAAEHSLLYGQNSLIDNNTVNTVFVAPSLLQYFNIILQHPPTSHNIPQIPSA